MPQEKSDFYRATGLDSVAPDLIYDDVQVGFTLADRSVLVIAIPRGALGVLLARLAGAAAALPHSPDSRNAVAQPLSVQSFRAFSLRDGRKGINFEASNVDLPLVFSESQVEDLARLVVQLPEMSPPGNSDLQ